MAAKAPSPIRNTVYLPMINSMTGYGEAQGEVNGVIYSVQIKSVNNRYLKTTVKLPETVAFLEENVEKLLRKNLSRGTVSYVLWLRNVSANVLFDINEAALRAVMERLGRIVSSADIKCPIDIGGLLSLPGVLEPVSLDEELTEQVREIVLSISQEAIDQLKQMRAAEGVALEADLTRQCEAIKQALEQIRARSAAVPREYHSRLKKRVDELLAGAQLKLDEEMLAKEVAVFAERSDISEEIARLDSHLHQFAETCQANTEAGHRLEFISQEMLREANTIASKASDTQIIHCVVDIKCRVQRIKEQVQNVE